MKEYPLPGLVRPLPVPILHCMESISQGSSPREIAIADLTWISLFFLFQPGEYCTGGTDTVSTPFILRNIQFFVETQPIQATKFSPSPCDVANFVSLVKRQSLDTTQQDTPAHVQWQPSGAVWHTYDITASPQTRILPQFSNGINGQRSAV